jgi:hypothetical protein
VTNPGWFWVVQRNIKAADLQKLVAALDAFQVPFYGLVDVVPFDSVVYSPDSRPMVLEAGDKAVFVYGTSTLCDYALRSGWKPGCFMNESFDYAKQIEAWGDRMLNHDAAISTFGEAPRLGDRIFIRPVLDSKLFAGMVLPFDGPGSYSEWVRKIAALGDESTLSLDTMILTTSVKDLQYEARYWIVDGRIVTSSPYNEEAYGRALPETGRLDRFVQESIGLWSPHRAFVLDVCISNDHFKIVEVNCINNAGFYGADLLKLVEAISSMK